MGWRIMHQLWVGCGDGTSYSTKFKNFWVVPRTVRDNIINGILSLGSTQASGGTQNPPGPKSAPFSSSGPTRQQAPDAQDPVVEMSARPVVLLWAHLTAADIEASAIRSGMWRARNDDPVVVRKSSVQYHAAPDSERLIIRNEGVHTLALTAAFFPL